MKTKSHLVVELVTHGLPEDRAVYLAGRIYGKDKNPREAAQEIHDKLDTEVRASTVELNALKSALDKWPKGNHAVREPQPIEA